jgi:zinc/manganese transport system substrate-binding protein
MKMLMPIAFAAVLIAGAPSGTHAEAKVKAVASFSILGDMVKEVGGDRVEVITLVGPNGDAHVYQPTPADAKTLARADLLFLNGLGFEGWMERLEDSSGFKGKVVTASEGVKSIDIAEEHEQEGEAAHGHEDEHADRKAHEEHEEHAEHEGHHHGDLDPHAWQDLANGRIYVANIRDGLIAADPEGRATYEANAAKYLNEIATMDAHVKESLGRLPEARRKIITSHDAFAYFGKAYGLTIIAPEGVSTESEASAKDVAKIIRQIKAERIPAAFLENVTDRRLLDQIASETGAKIGGTLYSDALSEAGGPASTYLDMFRHNAEVLTAALSS